MDRTLHFFHYQKATLHYSMIGNGPKALFCFHGFGFTGTLFYPLESVIPSEYTIYNFDLFFHGKSTWDYGDTPIEEAFWAELISAFCTENNIPKFSLIAYSIGARPVWALTNKLPSKITEIIAIAPDGITNSFWYNIATRTNFTRLLFKKLLSNKIYITTFLNFGLFLRIMPAVTVRFAKSQLRTNEQRNRVYLTWVTFRKLKSNHTILSENINKFTIPITIYLGQYDKIIKYKMVKPLAEKIKTINIITLAAGHLNLLKKVFETIQFKK